MEIILKRYDFSSSQLSLRLCLFKAALLSFCSQLHEHHLFFVLQIHVRIMPSISSAVPLVFHPVRHLPPTAQAHVSVAASANQGLSSRDGAVCQWKNVAAWMKTTTIMRSDILRGTFSCIIMSWRQQIISLPAVNAGVMLLEEYSVTCQYWSFLLLLLLLPLLFSAWWGCKWWRLFKVVPLCRQLHFGMCW